MKSLKNLKKEAALRAVDFVESGMMLGLGSGSTTYFALKELGSRIISNRLKSVTGIPSSKQTAELAVKFGISLTNFDEHPEIDLTIDGADEVDSELNLIKGGGGALLREKILAQNSKRLIIIVDESKISAQLGTQVPVPVEVIPFGVSPVIKYLKSIGGNVTLRKTEAGEFYHTDQGNLILDCKFAPILDVNGLAMKLKQRAGIVEHGLFLNLATDVIVASENGIKHWKR